MNRPIRVPRTPSHNLKGRRALVTGASRGIGFAAAAALVQGGGAATLVARNERELEEAAAALRREGGQATALPLDVTDTARMKELMDSLPPFPILVNNAGTNVPAPFAQVEEKDYDRMFALNVRAAFFTAQAVARRLMAAHMPGSIINISSQMGHVGGIERTVYCATKHAMEGLTKAMAWDLGAAGIRVNSIRPTFIETDLVRPMLRKRDFRDYVLSKLALGRVGLVEDIMAAVVFLASDASSLMTGGALPLDGGWTAI